MTYGANQYKKTSVQTASKEQVLLMLYEAAIRHTKTAQVALKNGDIPGKGKSIGKTHDIINELLNTLNFDVGGDVAIELERLYTFMIEQLVKANVENSVEPLESVQSILENLFEGWKGAVEQIKSGKVNKATG